MAITFRGTSIPGIHTALIPPSPDPNVTRTVTMGLNGATQVVGGNTTSQFSCQVTLYNSFSTSSSCITAINSVKALQSKTGTIVETGNISQTLTNCHLDKVDVIREPIPISGATSISPGTYTGWMAVLQLTFTQLRT